MSDSTERRRSARVLSQFPLTLLDDRGEVLDQHAAAHDVSDKGMKIESQAELTPGRFIHFALAIDERGDIKGRAKIVWVERTDLSFWAGAQFLKMSAADRRRVRRVGGPAGVDWNALADRAIVALSVALATVVGWRLLSSPVWRGLAGEMLPSALAALAMGWALRVLLRRR